MTRCADYELARSNHAAIAGMRNPSPNFRTYQIAYRNYDAHACQPSRRSPLYPFWTAGIDNRRAHDTQGRIP